jgi:imidazole glycerol-phosphate synthase subunit HisH
MTTIVDYGVGNIASVMNMIVKAGGKAKISSDPRELAIATRLIIPGVGSFDHGVSQLKKFGHFGVIQEASLMGIPILGICLGMQLLCNRSEEGIQSGLGLIDAECKKFSFDNDLPKLRTPHVGWNNVKAVKKNPLISIAEFDLRFYFTHSFHVVCEKESDILATFEYGSRYVAAISNNNVYGVQFHPEKSHRFGMALIKNFLSIEC